MKFAWIRRVGSTVLIVGTNGASEVNATDLLNVRVYHWNWTKILTNGGAEIEFLGNFLSEEEAKCRVNDFLGKYSPLSLSRTLLIPLHLFVAMLIFQSFKIFILFAANAVLYVLLILWLFAPEQQ
jgi:hypothetical protein